LVAFAASFRDRLLREQLKSFCDQRTWRDACYFCVRCGCSGGCLVGFHHRRPPLRVFLYLSTIPKAVVRRQKSSEQTGWMEQKNHAVRVRERRLLADAKWQRCLRE